MSIEREDLTELQAKLDRCNGVRIERDPSCPSYAHFQDITGKLLFTVPIDQIYDGAGNRFNDDLD